MTGRSPAPGLLRPDGPARRTVRATVRWGRRFSLGRALACLLMAVLVAVRIWDPPPVEAVRLRTFDAYQVLQPRTPPPQAPVVIVDIDEASLRRFGQWPWPRTRMAELVTRLTRMGALVVAFDIVFAEPDRLSPGLVADAIPGLDAATRDALRALPSNDEVFARAISASRVILGQTALAERVEAAGGGSPPQTGFAMMGPDPSRFMTTYPGLLRNVPALEEAAAGRGLFTISPELDGIVRRVAMVMKAGGEPVPTLTLEILRVLTGAGAILVKSDEAGIQSVVLPGVELPTDPYGQVWVHFSPHDPARFVSARDVLADEVPDGRFENKIVLVGTSAIGLLDTKTTPLERAMPGVEVHAQLLESALTRSTLIVPNYAVAVELIVALAVAFAIILFAPILGALTLLALGAAVAAALVAASWYRYSHSGILLDASFPLASSFLVYLTLVFTNYVREQLGRTRIRSAFGQYLSPALVEQLALSPEKLKLGGEDRVLTIMFSDVRGFTGISESYKDDPQGLTALMNRVLTPLTNAILDRRGTIDKYMGDAIMAFWNAPLDDPDQEANAARAALDMLARLTRVNAERDADAARAGLGAPLPIHVGIGLNTGRCVVGNLGSELRFDYSVLGDTVNVASRLEGQSKTYGLRIMLGSSTARAIRDRFAVLEVDLIRVKGKTEPEAISTLLGDAAVREQPAFAALARAHAGMIAAYRGRDWDEARAGAARCKALATGLDLDGLYDLYLARIEGYALAPPPPDWTGVHVAASK